MLYKYVIKAKDDESLSLELKIALFDKVIDFIESSWKKKHEELLIDDEDAREQERLANLKTHKSFLN